MFYSVSSFNGPGFGLRLARRKQKALIASTQEKALLNGHINFFLSNLLFTLHRLLNQSFSYKFYIKFEGKQNLQNVFSVRTCTLYNVHFYKNVRFFLYNFQQSSNRHQKKKIYDENSHYFLQCTIFAIIARKKIIT